MKIKLTKSINKNNYILFLTFFFKVKLTLLKSEKKKKTTKIQTQVKDQAHQASSQIV